MLQQLRSAVVTFESRLGGHLLSLSLTCEHVQVSLNLKTETEISFGATTSSAHHSASSPRFSRLPPTHSWVNPSRCGSLACCFTFTALCKLLLSPATTPQPLGGPLPPLPPCPRLQVPCSPAPCSGDPSLPSSSSASPQRHLCSHLLLLFDCRSWKLRLCYRFTFFGVSHTYPFSVHIC